VPATESEETSEKIGEQPNPAYGALKNNVQSRDQHRDLGKAQERKLPAVVSRLSKPASDRSAMGSHFPGAIRPRHPEALRARGRGLDQSARKRGGPTSDPVTKRRSIRHASVSKSLTRSVKR